MNLRKLILPFFGRPDGLDLDFDKVGARPDARIHAASGDQLGLGELVGREDFKDGDEVLVRKLVRLTVEQAADVAFREAAPPGQFALVAPSARQFAPTGVGERRACAWTAGRGLWSALARTRNG